MKLISKLLLIFVLSVSFDFSYGQQEQGNRIFVNIGKFDSDTGRDEILCVATIFTSRLALTTATCLNVDPSIPLYITFTWSNGVFPVFNRQRFEEIFIHPNFNITGNNENNIAMIRSNFGEIYFGLDQSLDQRVPGEPRVPGALATNSSCVIRMTPLIDFEPVRMYAPQYCNHTSIANAHCSMSSCFRPCAAEHASPVVCSQGGPFMSIVHGILISPRDCEPNYTDNRQFYLSLSDYADWINETISLHSSSRKKVESLLLILSLIFVTFPVKNLFKPHD
ncbi:CLUMA_CG003424, isoform A [Clunio marinus]|uniref:CLUMA_CG003424, isoform A n=1 Tax=Clunio marinus TaxID=568069 RepID=A0A1J1HQN9_9DIPT|nr:CLUMA_CG003424, isoform A [Clunio marinus]